MSNEKIERIIKTHPPVEGMPGYVWFSKPNNQIVKIETLRKAYEEYFAERTNERKEDE